MQTVSLLETCLTDPLGGAGPVLEAVLESADSLMTYRSRYRANLQTVAVLDLLLTDETNPRSVAFQLVKLNQHVEELPRDRSSPGYATEQRIAMTLLHSVRILDVRAVAELHALGEHDHLKRALEKLAKRLPELSDALGHRYLIHAGLPRQLEDLRPSLP